MAALANLGWSLMTNGEFEKALSLLENCLSIRREHLPGDRMDLANSEIVFTILGWLHDISRRNELVVK